MRFLCLPIRPVLRQRRLLFLPAKSLRAPDPHNATSVLHWPPLGGGGGVGFLGREMRNCYNAMAAEEQETERPRVEEYNKNGWCAAGMTIR